MRKETGRTRRIAELLQRELAVLIPRELGDPRLAQLTLTGVDVAPDLSHAKVYITQLSGVANAPATLAVLNGAAGFLRHALRSRLDLRIIPELRFCTMSRWNAARKSRACLNALGPGTATGRSAENVPAGR